MSFFHLELAVQPPRAEDYITETQSQTWEALFWAVGQGCPRNSQNIRPLAIALDCPMKWKTRLCSWMHFWNRGIWVEMDLNAPSLGTSMVPESDMKNYKGDIQQSYPAATPTNHFNNQHSTLTEECNSGTHNLLATTSSLIGLTTSSTRWEP